MDANHANHNAQTTQTTPERTVGAAEDWLTGLESPGGIRGGPAAVVVEADAPNGDDGALEVTGSDGARPQWGGAATGRGCSWARL
jgi:hypothetical protein